MQMISPMRPNKSLGGYLEFLTDAGILLKDYPPLINLLKKEVTNETINHRFSIADINSSLCFGSDEAKQLN